VVSLLLMPLQDGAYTPLSLPSLSEASMTVSRSCANRRRSTQLQTLRTWHCTLP